jgi:hypothetical protein
MSIRRGILTALLLLAACDKAEPKLDASRAAAPALAAAPVVEIATSDAPTSTEMPDDDQPTTPRMVVRNATLRLRADSPDAVAATAARLAEQAGGFVASSDTQGVGEQIHRVDASLRVPADRFPEVLTQLRAEGELLQETITGEDVTEQHADVDARLRSQRTLEERLLTILGSVQSVEDALAVEAQLVGVRTEIERLEARLRTMNDRVALATISLVVEAPMQANPVHAETVSSQLDRALDDSGELFVDCLAGLIRTLGALLPLMLAFGPLGYVLRRRWLRRQQQALMVSARLQAQAQAWPQPPVG